MKTEFLLAQLLLSTLVSVGIVLAASSRRPFRSTHAPKGELSRIWGAVALFCSLFCNGCILGAESVYVHID